MSYRCMVTGKISKECEKLNKIVVKTRAVKYTHWDNEAEENWQSVGTEIVKEINASFVGVEIWEALTPEERSQFVASLS